MSKEELFQKPLWQLSCPEFCELIKIAFAENSVNGVSLSTSHTTEKSYAYGISELGDKIGCCNSTIYLLRKGGILDEAIISQIGKKIVFDVDKARSLAEEYKRKLRENRRLKTSQNTEVE